VRTSNRLPVDARSQTGSCHGPDTATGVFGSSNPLVFASSGGQVFAPLGHRASHFLAGTESGWMTGSGGGSERFGGWTGNSSRIGGGATPGGSTGTSGGGSGNLIVKLGFGGAEPSLAGSSEIGGIAGISGNPNEPGAGATGSTSGAEEENFERSGTGGIATGFGVGAVFLVPRPGDRSAGMGRGVGSFMGGALLGAVVVGAGGAGSSSTDVGGGSGAVTVGFTVGPPASGRRIGTVRY